MSKIQSTATVVVYSKQVEEFVSQYRVSVQKTASAILELANVVKSAHDSLNDEDFQLFRQEIGADEAKDSYIKKLIRIAKVSSRFADMSDKLPPSYTTLYTLSQLSDDVFLKVCSENVITPRMTAAALSPFVNKKQKKVELEATLSFKNVEDFDKSIAFNLIKQLCNKFKIELKFNIESPFSAQIKSLTDLNAVPVPDEDVTPKVDVEVATA